MHVVRPDRFFPDHAVSLVMRATTGRLGADGEVYKRNHILNLPYQSKIRDGRIQDLINGQFFDHVLTTTFDTDATKLTIDVPPHVPSARRKAVATVPSPDATVPLAPWPHPSESGPNDLAMTSPLRA